LRISYCYLIILFQRLKLRKEKGSATPSDPSAEMRERIIRRAALEFHDGIYGKVRNQMQ
jgi:hypothetical protein